MGQDVTVTITNWNGQHYLQPCIAAVQTQTVTPARVIVVDNASTDGSVEYLVDQHPDVEVLQLDSNDGPSAARNAGLEAAQTRYVLSIDNDAMLEPNCLEELLKGLADDVAIVQPRALFDADPTLIHYDGADMHYAGIMTLRNFYRPVSEASDKYSDLGAAISVALLLDRDKCLEVGAYDKRHFILFEDHDFSYRVRMRGYRIIHAPKARLLHREGTAGISFREKGQYTPQRVFLHSRNRWIVLTKCAAASTLVLGLPGILLYEGAYFFFALKNGSTLAWISGKLAWLKLLPELWAERRVIQKSRRVSDRQLLTADPLTVSPLIERKGMIPKLQRGLDRVLSALW